MTEQFPALGGINDDNCGFGNIVETEDAVDDTDEAMASKEVNLSDLNALKQQLTKAEAKLKAEKKMPGQLSESLNM